MWGMGKQSNVCLASTHSSCVFKDCPTQSFVAVAQEPCQGAEVRGRRRLKGEVAVGKLLLLHRLTIGWKKVGGGGPMANNRLEVIITVIRLFLKVKTVQRCSVGSSIS